jgi:hypothetical protein
MYIEELTYFLEALRENNYLSPEGFVAVSGIIEASKAATFPQMDKKSPIRSQHSVVDSFMAHSKDLPGAIQEISLLNSSLDNLTTSMLEYYMTVEGTSLDPKHRGDKELAREGILRYLLTRVLDKERVAIKDLMFPITRQARRSDNPVNVENTVAIAHRGRFFTFRKMEFPRIDGARRAYQDRITPSFLGDWGFTFPLSDEDANTTFQHLKEDQKKKMVVSTLRANSTEIKASLSLLLGIRNREDDLKLVKHLLANDGPITYIREIISLIDNY